MRRGTVYTETVVHLAPERLAAEAPYQVAIIELEDGGRVTARVRGDRVGIGDKVSEAVVEDGVHFFQKLH
jgi:uncharacterized OB-fold protein